MAITSRVKHDDYYAMHTYVYDAMKKYFIFETREQNKILIILLSESFNYKSIKIYKLDYYLKKKLFFFLISCQLLNED